MTLVETLVAAGLLSVGVLALADTLFFATEGVAETRQHTAARELARQRVEWLATLPFEELPPCVIDEGCRSGMTAYAADKPAAGTFPCTERLEGMSHRDPTGANAVDGSYRVDTSLAPHPAPGQQLGGQILTVSVCWTDMDRSVEQVQSQRMLLPEM